MSQLERIYKIDRMLRRKQPPSRQQLVNTLEISPAQLKRDFAFMRDRLGAPITFAPNLAGGTAPKMADGAVGRGRGAARMHLAG